MRTPTNASLTDIKYVHHFLSTRDLWDTMRFWSLLFEFEVDDYFIGKQFNPVITCSTWPVSWIIVKPCMKKILYEIGRNPVGTVGCNYFIAYPVFLFVDISAEIWLRRSGIDIGKEISTSTTWFSFVKRRQWETWERIKQQGVQRSSGAVLNVL